MSSRKFRPVSKLIKRSLTPTNSNDDFHCTFFSQEIEDKGFLAAAFDNSHEFLFCSEESIVDNSIVDNSVIDVPMRSSDFSNRFLLELSFSR